jgi:tripartite-type tricarboxylate transporter receptor subunit TctC
MPPVSFIHPLSPRRRQLLRWSGSLPLLALAGQSSAQTPASAAGSTTLLPTRPLRLVVPFPAGGPTDALARLMADGLAAPLGQSVVVDNRPGASGGIAAEFVSRSPPDGQTLLVAGQGLMFINKALYRNRKLAYDPDRDYSYLGMLGSFPNVVVSNSQALAAHSIEELIAQARANPGLVSYGSNGIGSLTHLSAEVIATTANVKFLHVPYQGAAPQLADLLAGRVGFTINGVQSVLPLIQQGRLRALAVTTASRLPQLPDVPTLAESGFPGLDLPVWFAVYAPAATPAAVQARLRTAIDAVTSTPAYAAELARRGAAVMKVPFEASAATFGRERKLWIDAVQTTGASAD